MFTLKMMGSWCWLILNSSPLYDLLTAIGIDNHVYLEDDGLVVLADSKLPTDTINDVYLEDDGLVVLGEPELLLGIDKLLGQHTHVLHLTGLVKPEKKTINSRQDFIFFERGRGPGPNLLTKTLKQKIKNGTLKQPPLKKITTS